MTPLLAIAVLAQITITAGVGKQSHSDSIRTARHRLHEDSLAARRDSLRRGRDSAAVEKRRASRIALTPALLATAFADSGAGTLLQRARTARLSQDSSLMSYDATAYERQSVGLRLGPLGRDRSLWRSERSARVQWARGRGAVIDVTGARAVMPIVEGTSSSVSTGSRSLPIPYFPGRESLWIGTGLARADVSAHEVIHPLATGAEAYYTYASGDSLLLQLPGGGHIVVRELRVRPRRSSWNVVIGSLWFDASTGQLVRGVYRPAEPADMLAIATDDEGKSPREDIPLPMRPLITPMTGSVDAITVDYGLFNGRFWLPRAQTVQGSVRMGVVRAPFELTRHFDYSDVNGRADVPTIQLAPTDTARGADALGARRAAREAACRNGAAERLSRQSRYDNTLAVLVRVPCDTAALARSPTLPASIYERPDTLFRDAELDALIRSTLSIGQQGGASRQKPVVGWGLAYTRYNRIEGLSTAVGVRLDPGYGYSGRALVRLGMDLSPDGEFALSRGNGRESYTATLYRRLDSANDWGRDPFTLGASLSALLLGHDDGVYYRSWGAELVHEQENGWLDSWRLFVEREFDARVHTRFSLLGRLDGGRFPDNIDATSGSVAGVALRKRASFGLDPMGPRAMTDVQLEGAAGSFDYARGMAGATLMRPVAGPVSAALTLSGGSSLGNVPSQRLWYLGGSTTVRGQDVGVAVGDAFWLTRLELGVGSVAARPVVFGDLGWAGDRGSLTRAVMPVSGAGIGASFLDGLIRFDLAHGIRPSTGIRASMYLDARF